MDVRCGDCGGTNGHEKDCKYAAKKAEPKQEVVPADTKRAYMVGKIEKKKSAKKGEYLTLSVTTNEGSGLLYCWHKSLFSVLTVGDHGKPGVALIAEISEQLTDDKKKFYSVERVLEFEGLTFGDEPAEQGIVEADPGESVRRKRLIRKSSVDGIEHTGPWFVLVRAHDHVWRDLSAAGLLTDKMIEVLKERIK